MCMFTVTFRKKIRVGRSDFFKYFFFILKYSEFGFLELLFVIFLHLLTALNTLSTVIDDIIQFGSR
jgi:ACT domain-containing protein